MDKINFNNKNIYDVSQIEFLQDGAYILAGKRRSGKSTILKDLLVNLMEN